MSKYRTDIVEVRARNWSFKPRCFCYTMIAQKFLQLLHFRRARSNLAVILMMSHSSFAGMIASAASFLAL